MRSSTKSGYGLGCLYPLLGLLSLYALYVILWRWLVPDPVVPFVFGLFTAIGAGGLWNGLSDLLRSRKLEAAIRRDAEGAPKKGGRFEAAAGIIQPVREALNSPFQGLSCVAYEYDVVVTGKDNQEGGSDAWGWALVPTIIRSKGGDLRLLAFPNLESFDEAVVGEEGRDRIQEYFLQTAFETIGKADLIKGLGQVLGRSLDDDGLVRTDILRGKDLNPLAVPFENRRFTERLVPVGAEVTAFGIYSAAEAGLISNPKTLSELLQIRPGKGEELAAVIENESSGRLFLGGLVFFLTHAFCSIAIFILWLKGYYG